MRTRRTGAKSSSRLLSCLGDEIHDLASEGTARAYLTPDHNLFARKWKNLSPLSQCILGAYDPRVGMVIVPKHPCTCSCGKRQGRHWA